MMKKQTKGRQKLELKKIENERDLVVTFTKRKTGALKKASELATLTGAEVAFLCFSPAGKPYCFAHPSIDSVAEHFLNPSSTSTENRYEKVVTDAQRNAKTCEIYKQYSDLTCQLEAAKAEGKRIEEPWKGKDISGWWTACPEKLSEEKMKQMNDNYMDLYGRLIDQLTQKGAMPPFSSGVALPYAGTSERLPPSMLYPMTNTLGVGVGVGGGAATDQTLASDLLVTDAFGVGVGGVAGAASDQTLVSDLLVSDAFGSQMGGGGGGPLSFNGLPG